MHLNYFWHFEKTLSTWTRHQIQRNATAQNSSANTAIKCFRWKMVIPSLQKSAPAYLGAIPFICLWPNRLCWHYQFIIPILLQFYWNGIESTFRKMSSTKKVTPLSVSSWPVVMWSSQSFWLPSRWKFAVYASSHDDVRSHQVVHLVLVLWPVKNGTSLNVFDDWWSQLFRSVVLHFTISCLW